MSAQPPAAGLDLALGALDDWGAAHAWIGPDPYEGLNSPAARFLRGPLAERVAIQIVKRAPVDLRRPLRIKPRPSSAGLAHVLAATTRMGRAGVLGTRETERRPGELIAMLARLRTEGHAGAAWGYPFDVRTRFFRYAEGTPNTIATAIAGLALLDAHAEFGSSDALALAEGAGEFFLTEVPQTPADGGGYFGYLPGDHTPVHNANLLASAFLAALGARIDVQRFTDAARSGVQYAIAQQHDDGSWPYAEDPRGVWVDGLHTGYALDALLIAGSALGFEPALAAYDRGIAFYENRLIDPDGAARALVGNRYPIDGQYAAQAIRSFALASRRDPEWLETALRVFRFAHKRLRRSDGAYVFQRHRLWTNRTPHVRWVQAPMLDALTILQEALRYPDQSSPRLPGRPPARVG